MKKVPILILLILSCLHVNNGLVKDKRSHVIFSEQRMISYAQEIGVKYIDVMVAQSRIETGRYTSKVFTEGMNLFGMKLPERRITTAVGEHRNHAKYDSWLRSVDDYKIWQSNVLTKVKSKKQYLTYIGRNYAQDPKYLNLIKQQL